jgi:RNA polymerase subunit RPABC4/transcription elongation factor Spt4
MMAEGRGDVFLSCFKCGRIVRAGDSECPRCGLQFGPGTLFECPFCSGLVWRNASKCSTCGIDLTEFSISVERTFAGFDMDEFVENIINTELEQLRSSARRVACPGCGLMIRGDEEKCPRCDLPLGDVSVVCPVCGEKMTIDMTCCPNCKAVFADDDIRVVSVEAGESATPSVEQVGVKAEAAPAAADVAKRRKAPSKKAPAKKKPAKKKTTEKAKKEGAGKKKAGGKKRSSTRGKGTK